MSPHFINNILTSLQLSLITDDILEINRCFENYSSVLRQTLNMCDIDTVELSKEIQYIKNYVELENSILEPKIDLIIDVSSEININLIKIPTMMLQPIVENSIRHGLQNKSGDRTIQMSFSLNANLLICNVQDNGIGRKAAASLSKNKERISWGTRILENRMRISSILGKEMSMKIFDLGSKHNSEGTKTELKIEL